MKSPPIHKTRCSIIHLAECKASVIPGEAIILRADALRVCIAYVSIPRCFAVYRNLLPAPSIINIKLILSGSQPTSGRAQYF